jgi:ribonuclease P/MRP protein subunit RPP40
VDVILLDFAKAFDTNPHRRLLCKLKVYGISGLTLWWIEAFLSNRKQRIVLGLINISKLYADDTKIISKLVSDESTINLQVDLNSAFKWTQDWLVKFNIAKCMVMHYGSNNKKSPLFINGQQLITT